MNLMDLTALLLFLAMAAPLAIFGYLIWRSINNRSVYRALYWNGMELKEYKIKEKDVTDEFIFIPHMKKAFVRKARGKVVQPIVLKKPLGKMFVFFLHKDYVLPISFDELVDGKVNGVPPDVLQSLIDGNDIKNALTTVKNLNDKFLDAKLLSGIGIGLGVGIVISQMFLQPQTINAVVSVTKEQAQQLVTTVGMVMLPAIGGIILG